jgi:tetratricopeptide (TPR) repeat protein
MTPGRITIWELRNKQIDDLPHASAELERAAELDPSLAEAHYSLGLTYIDAGAADKAIEQFRRAVAQRPEYIDAWYILGTTLRQQGDVAGAIDALRRSVTLDKQNAAAWNNLGLMLRRKGDTAGAQEAFAKAAEIRQAEEHEKEKQLQRGMARNPK